MNKWNRRKYLYVVVTSGLCVGRIAPPLMCKPSLSAGRNIVTGLFRSAKRSIWLVEHQKIWTCYEKIWNVSSRLRQWSWCGVALSVWNCYVYSAFFSPETEKHREPVQYLQIVCEWIFSQSKPPTMFNRSQATLQSNFSTLSREYCSLTKAD